jgi:TRAP-type C4-dicarboxylate transport system permease small subunit
MLLMILCTVITVINIVQVAGRYLFFYSIPWSETLSIVLFLMIVFLGQSIVTGKDGEIRIELFLNKKLQLIASDVICIATVCFLFISSCYLISHAAKFPQIIPSLYLPYYYVFWMMPVGFGLIIFSRICVLLKRFAPLVQSDGALEREVV